MAPENKRPFEVRLRKSGIITLVSGMSGLLFVFFLFGVVVGNNLDVYPEKISRQLPVQFLQWCGLLENDKTVLAVADRHAEKQKNQGAEKIPEVVVRHVQHDRQKPEKDAASQVSAPTPQAKPSPAPSQAKESTPSQAKQSAPAPQAKPSPAPPQAKQSIPAPQAKPSPAPQTKPPEKKTGEAAKSDKEKQTEKYLVQVTSCKDRKIAEEVVVKIAGVGFKGQITVVDLHEKGIWYRVTIPSFKSRNEAAEAAQKVDNVLKGNQSVVRVQR